MKGPANSGTGPGRVQPELPTPASSLPTDPGEVAPVLQVQPTGVPSAQELPAPPAPRKPDRIPVPKWPLFLLLIVIVASGGYYYWLSQDGTLLETEGAVAFSNTVLALAAVFGIYLTVLRGLNPPEE